MYFVVMPNNNVRRWKKAQIFHKREMFSRKNEMIELMKVEIVSGGGGGWMPTALK